MRIRPTFPAAITALVLAASLHAQVGAPARPFVGQEQQIEEFLRTAEVVRYEDVSVGVTRPTRAYLKQGGPVASVLWKPLRPGMYRGFYESYKSEIAAYELDKALELHMVPPTVERKLNGITGAVSMWLENMRMWRDLPSERPPTREWNAQMVRMKMFDCFIGNIDRNAGNILVDDEWTAYLVDHSRAFVTYREPPPSFTMVDPSLWSRMQALDEARLKQIIGQWISDKSISAILQRRDRMAKEIAKLVEKRGEKTFIHE